MKNHRKRILATLLCLVLLFCTATQYPLPATAEMVTVSPTVCIGNEFVVALASDGSAWSWGQNDAGQLGNGSITVQNQSIPAKVSTERRFQSLSAGDAHVLALATDGTVWAWGENGSGQLGDESTVDRSEPIAVHGLSDVTVRQVVAGGNTSFALTEDRRVLAWGANTVGMLGDASLAVAEVRPLPTPIAALEGVRIECLIAGERTVAAIASDGSVWLWGENSDMQCGVSTGLDISTPTQKISSATERSYQALTVALGRYHTAILSVDDVILNIGRNANGQFGNGTVSEGLSYLLKDGKCTDTENVTGIISVAAGSEHMLALTKEGSLYAWGKNDIGQLAADQSEASYLHTPRQIATEALVGGKVIAIAAGYGNSALIDSNGYVFLWGSNSAGQLGRGQEGEGSHTLGAVLGSNGEGYLSLGTAEEDVTHQVYVTANATIPAPNFSISIPATLDFGKLEQKSEVAEDRDRVLDFSVTAANVKYLFGKTIVVEVSPAQGDAFVLIGTNGSTLPYKVYSASQGSDPLAVHATFATFTAAGSVGGSLVIDQSEISVADQYTGTLIFRISTVEAAGS